MNYFNPTPKRGTFWRKALSLFALAAVACLPSSAQVNTYTFTPVAGTYTPLSGATATSLVATADDAMSTAFNIGFNFVFNGNTYTQVMASSNGTLLFGTGRTQSTTNNLATTTATQRPGVAPLWDDLQCTAGATYQVSGTSPNQVLTVEWLNMEWNYSSGTPAISFQVKLYETTNVIECIYRQEATAAASGSASIGIMGTASTDFISLQNTSASPTTSTTTSTNNLSAKPATGQIYRFTPTVACTGTPDGGATTGPAGACSGVNFTLALQGATSAPGITYQWQSADDAAFTVGLTSLGTASSQVTSQTAPKYYRCLVTCTGSGLSDYSTPLQVVMNSPTSCYCTPSISTVEPICNVTFAGINNTTPSTGGVGVEDFTAITANVSPGLSYTMDLTGNSVGSFTNYFTAFFDWDQDGVFETVVPIGSFTNSVCASVVSGTITVPPTALLGTSRMRVIKNYNTSPTNPCGSYSFGQVEDYSVNVTAASCTPPVATTTVVPDCGNGQFSVSVNLTALGDAPNVDITENVNGGGETVVHNDVSALTTYMMGPYATGTSVDIRVLHNGDNTCDVNLGTILYNCPPANDDCAGAVALTVNPDLNCGSVTSGTVLYATNSGQNTCSGTEDDDVWYSFTATATSHQISLINITGSTSDMMIGVYSGACGGLTSVACSDPETMTASGLTVGQTYYVQVYTYTSTPGQTSSFDICVGTFPAAPANDDCAGAVALTVNPDLNCGSVTHGTVASATNSGQNTCSGTEDDDVWYSFTATATSHQISLINITGSTSDMMIGVYSGACGGLTSVACSDPETMTASGLTVGQTYYVQVYTWTSTPGQTSSFDVCVGTLPAPPANDNCAGAVALTVNPDLNCGSVTHGTVVSATNSGQNTCFGTADDDVWYSFTATATSHQISLINRTGSTTDMMIGVYSGACGGLTSVACSDPETMTASGLTIGQTYYVQVYTYTSTPGQTTNFDVCVGTLPPPPANDDCSGAIAIACGGSVSGNTSTANNADAPTGCSTSLNTAPGVWYTATGNGYNMTASLCASAYDTKIGIFTGSCGSFTCVASNDDDCGTQSSVTWASVAGTTYYIYVTGYSSNAGAYTLNLTCDGPVVCTGNQVVVNINTDPYYTETSWEIRDGSNAVVASGAPTQANSLNSDTVCLGSTPGPACYTLTLFDSFGDGITNGGWELRTTGGKLILRDNFDTPYPDATQSPLTTPASPSYGSGHSFCLPLGPANIAANECGIFNNLQGNKVYCNKVT
ncbi:MAG: hypothetical protein JST45_12630, partial [Bacteroidetes bacterium]|nr:hypothetical protein [Bacteroidota bacterium]